MPVITASWEITVGTSSKTNIVLETGLFDMIYQLKMMMSHQMEEMMHHLVESRISFIHRRYIVGPQMAKLVHNYKNMGLGGYIYS